MSAGKPAQPEVLVGDFCAFGSALEAMPRVRRPAGDRLSGDGGVVDLGIGDQAACSVLKVAFTEPHSVKATFSDS